MPFNFNCQYLQAFKLLKKQLMSASVLIHYNPYQPTKLETNALDGVVVGVLMLLPQHCPMLVCCTVTSILTTTSNFEYFINFLNI